MVDITHTYTDKDKVTTPLVETNCLKIDDGEITTLSDQPAGNALDFVNRTGTEAIINSLYVNTIEDLRNTLPDPFVKVHVLGFDLVGDYSGMFRWDAISTEAETDNNTIVKIHTVDIGRWKLISPKLGELSSTNIKSLYESNEDTNAFTDIEKTKLNNLDSNDSLVYDFVASGYLPEGSKVSLKQDGTVELTQNPNNNDETVTLSNPVAFNSSNTFYISSVYDSINGKVVISYCDNANGNYGTAIVGTVSGTSISFGTPVVFNNTETYYGSLIHDSTNNKIVISYQNGSNFYGTAIVGTVSDTAITFGTPVVFNSAVTDNISSVHDSINDKVVISYRNDVNNSYGTTIVGTVSGDSITFGTPVVFNSAVTYFISSMYDSTNGKVVISYQNNSNNAYGTVIIGTVSGDSISFGTAVIFNSAVTNYISSVYDSINGKVVISYCDNANGNYGTAIVGTVSGTSISFGTPVVFDNTATAHISSTYDSTKGKVIISYTDETDNNKGKFVIGTVSGDSISFDTPVVFNNDGTSYLSTIFDNTNNKIVISYSESTGNGMVSILNSYSLKSMTLSDPVVFNSTATENVSSVFDSTNGKVVISYSNGSYYGTAIVGTVSDTTITFGTPVVFNNDNTYEISSVFDSTNGKVVISYSNGSYYGTAIVGTVSDTTITFGTPVVFNSATITYISSTFDSINSKIIIAFRANGTDTYGKVIVGTVSGDSISFGTIVTFYASATSYISLTFDSTNGKVVISYRDEVNGGYGTTIIGTVSDTTITFGTPVVFNNGNMLCISSVFDSVNDKVVISYTDNILYGTTIVGAISGDSISFGTPVTFNNNITTYISSTYDSANGKVVISYSNGSYYGTFIIGTVSGTSIIFSTEVVFNSDTTLYTSLICDSINNQVVISYVNIAYGTISLLDLNLTDLTTSFGTPVVFNNDATINISSVYDSINDKVIISYRNSSGYGTTIVGTVSEDSITFGTPVVFNIAITYNISSVYDSTNGKVVISYQDTNAYGTTRVGTVSGTSISFGTPVIFNNDVTYNISSVYDSTNDKVIISYRDDVNILYGTTIIGTVSGTSISFGTPVIFNNDVTNFISSVYDSINNKIVISYENNGNNNYGTVIIGTVLGDSITFGTPVVFNSAITTYISSVYDSTNGKIIISYQNDSGYGTTIVGTVSEDSITFGTPVVFNIAITYNISSVYDSTNGKVVISYQDTNAYGTTIIGTVSEDSITFGTPVVFYNGNTFFLSSVFDSINNKVIISYRDGSNYGTTIVGSIVSVNFVPMELDSFIGIVQESTFNRQLAPVVCLGGIDTHQYGLIPNTTYYLTSQLLLTSTEPAEGEDYIVFGKSLGYNDILLKGI